MIVDGILAFFLKNPNGSLRLLTDFRGINRHLQRNQYYVPRIQEILLRLAGAKCLSTLDTNIGVLRASSRYTKSWFFGFLSTRRNVSVQAAPDGNFYGDGQISSMHGEDTW